MNEIIIEIIFHATAKQRARVTDRRDGRQWLCRTVGEAVEYVETVLDPEESCAHLVGTADVEILKVEKGTGFAL